MSEFEFINLMHLSIFLEVARSCKSGRDKVARKSGRDKINV